MTPRESFDSISTLKLYTLNHLVQISPRHLVSPIQVFLHPDWTSQRPQRHHRPWQTIASGVTEEQRETGQTMSNTDSFIDEVTEEVRRDRTFAFIKRFGWIAGVAVIAIVGGAAYNEYSKAQIADKAEAFGDSLLDASAADTPEARAEALGAVQAPDATAAAIVAQMRAQALVEAGEFDAAIEALNTVAGNGELPRIYRDIAAFKALRIAPETQDIDARRVALEALAAPGAPLRLLAMEELAYLEAGAGNRDAAVEALNRVLADAEVAADQRQRVRDTLTALGVAPETAAQ